MENTRNKKIKKFKKKSIWPQIILFVITTTLLVVLLGVFLYLFSSYVYTNESRAISKDAEFYSRIISNQLTKENASAKNVLEELSSTYNISEETSMCIMEKSGYIVASIGYESPDLSKMNTLNINFEEFEVHKQFVIGMKNDKMLIEDNKKFDFKLLLRNTVFLGRNLKEYFNLFIINPDEKWLEQSVYKQKIWTSNPIPMTSYVLLINNTVEINRADLRSIVPVCSFVLLILVGIIFAAILSIIHSIKQQKSLNDLLYRDFETNGYNWTYFRSYAYHCLKSFFHRSTTYAIVNISFNHYQDYCACFGTNNGELLLQKITGYLQARMNKGEFFARHSQAIFVLLLKVESIEEISVRVRTMLAELIGIQAEQKLDFSSGIYISNSPRKKGMSRNCDIDALFTYAEEARTSIQSGTEKYAVFTDEMFANRLFERKIEQSVLTSLMNEEFNIYLQPKFDAITEQMVGAEALVRWNSPEFGFIMPSVFIPIMERNGYITDLDDYMISHVAKLLAKWKIEGKKLVPISINISRVHFTQDNLAEHICSLVDAYGIPHEYIELELTESAFFDDKTVLKNTIERLKSYNFVISMDDFGSGFSSLNSLKDLPVDILKLDREFFLDSDNLQRQEVIIIEVLHLAKKLHVKTVAEGIENEEQVNFLAKHGCNMIQGNYFSKAITAKEFERFMES